MYTKRNYFKIYLQLEETINKINGLDTLKNFFYISKYQIDSANNDNFSGHQ